MRTISASVLPLQKSDWVLSAIDFHCLPKMLDWIKEGLDEEIEDEEIKSLIWNYNSKTNYRNYYDGSQDPKLDSNSNWDKIKKQVYSIAKYAIKNYS